MQIEKLLTAGEWLEVEGVKGYAEFGKFKLKVILIDPLEHLELLNEIGSLSENLTPEEAIKRTTALMNRILALVVGWDFESADGPVACTDENKALYLRRLLMHKVVQTDGMPDTQVLGRTIVDFAANAESALKN